MIDYRKKSLKFLYDVMRGQIKDVYNHISKDTSEVVTVDIPVTVEGRMKAAERILKYYTENTDGSGENGLVIIADIKDIDKLDNAAK